MFNLAPNPLFCQTCVNRCFFINQIKIYKYVYDEEWYDADYRAIDILIVKKSNYIWIGYWHPEIPSTNNKKLLELYKNIFKIKPQKEKRIVMIYESDIEDLTEEQLSDKANETINTLNLKIEELKYLRLE